MIRSVSFRFAVTRSGSDFAELIPLPGGAPAIRMDESAAIKTSFSGTFAAPEEDINLLTDEIRPYLILDGEEYALGVFLPATVQPEENATTKSVRIEAYDRCWLARDYRTEAMQYFAAGTNYISAVKSLLIETGNGTISATPTEHTLTEAREDWEPGTDYLSIINELLGEINYTQLWFDGRGVAMLHPFRSEVSASQIDHVLDETSVESLMLPTLKRETDLYAAPNVFTVICSNPDKSAGMTATAENTNPQSPLAIQKRGRRIVQVTNVDNCASQAELQLYADRLLTDSMLSGEVITVQTGLLPGFGVGEITALRFGEIFAICRERAWTMQLDVGGTMTHTLERQVLNLASS